MYYNLLLIILYFNCYFSLKDELINDTFSAGI